MVVSKVDLASTLTSDADEKVAGAQAVFLTGLSWVVVRYIDTNTTRQSVSGLASPLTPDLHARERP